MIPSFLLVLLASATPAFAESICPDYAADPTQLVALEPEATKGALSDDQKDCLEERYTGTAEQVTKNKISRVLLVNAYAFDTKYWASLVERHLQEVDRSDPDIAYLYAYHLFNTDKAARSEDAIKWSEVGLERKDIWTGNVFVSRVYGLMKLRAVAAASVWRAAEEEQARGGGPGTAAVEELRNRTKTFAREWVDFAKVAGRDTEESLELCMSAATRASACGEQE